MALTELELLRAQVAGYVVQLDDLKNKLNRSAYRTVAVLRLTKAARDKGLTTVLIKDVEKALL